MRLTFGGSVIAQKLATATGELYNGLTDDAGKVDTIVKYNNLTGKKLSFKEDDINNSWNEIQALKEKVYIYYEYVQFKRARFDCKNVEYDNGSGRIIKMEFEFNGDFE